MKTNFTILLFMIPFFFYGQDFKLKSNDSVRIYKELEKSKLLAVNFGNQSRGLERRYRKINGEYFMTSITYWKDNQFIWRCLTIFGDDIDFNLNFFKLNQMTKKENMDIMIPYETGNPWVKIKIENYEIVSAVEYFRNGILKKEYQFNAEINIEEN